MKKIVVTMGALALAATAAFAQEVTDTDGDGSYSLEELQAVYADLTEEAYAALDTNGDGTIDAEELQAAVDAGTLTVMQ